MIGDALHLLEPSLRQDANVGSWRHLCDMARHASEGRY
jgi:hypothetical protein